jgi:hypothetical protein
MAQTNANTSAAAGTGDKKEARNESGCPTWDTLGAGMNLPPFFRPNEDMKREGFQVTFLSDDPRKETESSFTDAKELWFDVDHQGTVQTWTISQMSLLLELKKNAPLSGKCFVIKLVPVDADFKKKRPTYKGKDRYEVKLVPIPSARAGQARVIAGPSLAEEVVVDD